MEAAELRTLVEVEDRHWWYTERRMLLARELRRLPEPGQIAIFDRSWYGRVLVERVEGFCTDKEWGRAYHEINSMEKTLAGNVLANL